MSISNIVDVIYEPYDVNKWHETAEAALTSLWESGSRYPQSASRAFRLRCPKMSDKNVPFAALIHPDNPSSGAYAGASFVLFPRSGGPAMVGLGVGTDGLGQDAEILGRPGHARKRHAIARWLNAVHGSTVAWAKHDPTQQLETVPAMIRGSMPFSAHEAALARYGSVVYLLFAPSDDRDTAADGVAAILDLLMAERGILCLQPARQHSTELNRQWLDHLLPAVDEASVRSALDYHRYVVLQGPPGTGKTRMALAVARSAYADRSLVVQFHANTTYETFVGGLAPVLATGSGSLTFAPRAGVLLRAISRSNQQPDSDFLLVIDEINRADLAKALGEAIFLLEPDPDMPRTLDVEYPFEELGGSRITMPPNLHILGTMNTADRSIAIVDVAVRRRFAFIDMWPRLDVVDPETCPLGAEAFRMLLGIFVDDAPPDAFSLMPGHSYFLARSDDQVKPKLRDGLIPLLREYLSQGFVAGFASEIRSYIDWVGDRAR